MVERYLYLTSVLSSFSLSNFSGNRGKRKLAQVTKEAKEQLADLQSKLQVANNGKINHRLFYELLFVM